MSCTMQFLFLEDLFCSSQSGSYMNRWIFIYILFSYIQEDTSVFTHKHNWPGKEMQSRMLSRMCEYLICLFLYGYRYKTGSCLK